MPGFQFRPESVRVRQFIWMPLLFKHIAYHILGGAWPHRSAALPTRTMGMLDLLYWTARFGLVAAWTVVAVLAWRPQGRARNVWLGYSALALVYASMRAWRWNYVLLERARGLLRRFEVYDDRIWFKLVVAVALVLVLVVILRSMRRIAREPAALLCGVGMALQGTLLAIETLSLDDFIPRLLVQQPVRYLAEGSFAVIALAAVGRRKTPSS